MARNRQFIRHLAVLLLGCTAPSASGHGTADVPGMPGERAIEFPDTAGYRTLVVDLHTHTVFSDGHVWPRIRVEEALRDGLDAVAITDHLEWQPHLEDIPHPDRNRSYDEAASARGDADLLVVRGTEITRHFPAGHMNAVFIDDANALFQAPAEAVEPFDPRLYYSRAGQWPAQQAVQAANDQGAFVFWNHPYSASGDATPEGPDGITRLNDFHRGNAQRGLLHGIEVANGDTYSEEAFQIALDLNLALIGVSDVHELIDWDYAPHAGGHRPVTLVLAETRSLEALRDALFARRTVVWFRNLLLGRAEHLGPLLAASLTVQQAAYRPGSEVVEVVMANASDAPLRLRNLSPFTFVEHADQLDVPAHGSVRFQVKPGAVVPALALEFEVQNALTAPKQPARMRFDLEPAPPS